MHGAKRSGGTSRWLLADADDLVATVPSTTADGTLLLNVATVLGDQDEPVPDPHPNRDETLTQGARSRPADPTDADAPTPGSPTARHSRLRRPCTRPTFPAALLTRFSS